MTADGMNFPDDMQRQETLPASAVDSDDSENNQILDGYPVSSPTASRAAIAVRYEEHSGPLPHPSILAGYEGILPGAADRILTMAENQQAHRMDQERRVVTSNVQRSQQGLYAGVWIATCGIGASCYFAFLGQAAVGAGLFGTTLLGIVSVFVTGKVQQKRELKAKAEAVPEEKAGSAKDKKMLPKGNISSQPKKPEG